MRLGIRTSVQTAVNTKEMAPKRRTEPTTASPIAIPIVRLNSATVGSGVVKEGKKEEGKKDTHKFSKKEKRRKKGHQ